MKIRYLLKKITLSDREKDYLEKKIQRFEKYFRSLTESTLQAEVEAEKDTKGIWRVELMIKSPYNLYRVSKKGKTFLEAVDLADAALQAQVRKGREKIKERRRKAERKG
ncbi:MAG TPA: ribosome-associated translation inhibitor RaiA [Candidatus Moranbacteria bacterium]|nr:ribosome-associated translation inhibitor RaiA [Candidatus Moranbacteria bacterium]